jgi:Caspase domain
MKPLFIFHLFLAFTCSVWAQTGKIHVLMFTDTYSNIAESCKRDRDDMKKELQNIQENTGLEVVYYDQYSYSPQAATQAINSLSCGSNDVIFFYYTGHGYRYANQSSPYPYMAFNAHTRSELSSSDMLSLTEVSDVLRTKNARLVLTFGDLCNSVMPLNEPRQMDVEINSSSPYRTLFLNSRGYVIATSSKAGQPSIATPSGSIWTKQFLNALKETVNKRQAITWEKLLSDTYQRTLTASKQEQSAVFKADVTIQTSAPVRASVIIED